MSVRQTLPYILAATLACAVLTLNTAHANDTAVFRDVLKPGGKDRSLAQKYADGYACGATGPNRTVPFMPTFEKCMNRKGWVLDHYTSNEIPAPGGTTVHYVDIKGDGHDHERGDAALQADTRACKRSRGQEHRGVPGRPRLEIYLDQIWTAASAQPHRRVVAAIFVVVVMVVGLAKLQQPRRRYSPHRRDEPNDTSELRRHECRDPGDQRHECRGGATNAA